MLFFKSELVQGHWKWIIMILTVRMFGLYSVNKALIHAVASEILVKSSLCIWQVHLIHNANLLFLLDCSPQEFLKWLKSFLLVTRMSEDKLHHIFHKVRLKPLAVMKYVWFVKDWGKHSYFSHHYIFWSWRWIPIATVAHGKVESTSTENSDTRGKMIKIYACSKFFRREKDVILEEENT